MIVVLRFERFIVDPVGNLEGAFREHGLRLSGDPRFEVPTFQELQLLKPRKCRRGRVRAWRNEMPPDLQEVFMQLQGATLRDVGYP